MLAELVHDDKNFNIVDFKNSYISESSVWSTHSFMN